MLARTVKGDMFTIIIGDKRVVVKHVPAKGKRCRVIAPDGVTIECGEHQAEQNSSEVKSLSPIRDDGKATKKTKEN